MPRTPATAPQQQQWRQRRRQQAATASAAADDSTVGVIIECDGALVDAHVNGHMVAFNRAFSVSFAASKAGPVLEAFRLACRCLRHSPPAT